MKTNLVFLIGYIGKEPVTNQQARRTSLRVATHYPIKVSETHTDYKTVWHDVVVWDDQSDFAQRNFVKGSRVFIQGMLDYRWYTDNAGKKRNSVQIKAHSLMNLDR